MTRQTIILLTTLTVWTATYGQTNKFDIGLEGGPSWTSLRGNDILEDFNDPTIGYSGGLTFQFNFPKLISLRTNIAYERKGVIAKTQAADINGNPIGEITTHSNFDYLTMPLLTRLTFGNKMTFFINVGP
ncbi:PorT family protein, partial [Candidatus Amoebophilus asiaticus]|nr:PorT family protein [Candidatus Amoebophilus asiaticus]